MVQVASKYIRYIISQQARFTDGENFGEQK